MAGESDADGFGWAGRVAEAEVLGLYRRERSEAERADVWAKIAAEDRVDEAVGSTSARASTEFLWTWIM